MNKTARLLSYVSDESGQIFVLAIGVLLIVLVTTIVLISGAFTYSASSKYSVDSLQANQLAEAGIDKAVAALNSTAGAYSGDPETTLGSGSYDVKVTNIDANNKIIESTGYIPSKATPKSKRTIKIQISKGDGISFGYGIQAGEGGFKMDGGSIVNGSVYSNGNIDLSGGARITGSATVAGGTQATADQETDCTNPNCAEYQFGKTISGQNRLDIAQSFKPQATSVINKVALKLKKFGSPANVTVRILSNNNNGTSSNEADDFPNKNSVLASGTLTSNLVTGNFGFVEVGFNTNPTLTSNTTYWIVIDSSSDNTNYWAWSQDTLSTYTRGMAKWSSNWQQNPNPTYTAISGDLGFKVYMGGVITKITGSGSSYIDGSAYANTMSGDNYSALQIAQHAYYQVQNSITVHGSNCNGNNSYCHPGSTDPQPQPLPISDANIDEWKDLADDQVQTGNLVIQWPCTTNLEKKKYVGNVTVQGGCSIQTDTPVWITGNLIVTGGSTIRLKPSYGITSGVIVVDGKITLDGGSRMQGSGTAGSYLTALSTKVTNSESDPSIYVSGGNSSSILYAGDGVIALDGGTNLREATAKRIYLTAGAIVTYESGVANPFFTTGPQGSFSVVKGSYQVK